MPQNLDTMIYSKNYLTTNYLYVCRIKNIKKSGIHIESVRENPDPEFRKKIFDNFFPSSIINISYYIYFLPKWFLPQKAYIPRPMVIGYKPIGQCLTMLKGRAICQSNCLDMGYNWLKPLSSGKSRKKVSLHKLALIWQFWGQPLSIWTRF